MLETPEYTISCSEKCSLRTNQVVNDDIARGISPKVIAAREKLVEMTVYRHKKHVHLVNQPEEPTAPATSEKVRHLDVLESIIAAGWQNREKWKPTIGDTMKAMDMYQKMTQGSVFQDLLDALASDVVEDDEPVVPEVPAAVTDVVPD